MDETPDHDALPGPLGIADGALKPLDPRFCPAERLASRITAVVVSAAILILFSVAWLLGWTAGWTLALMLVAWVAVTGALWWLAHAYPAWVYRHTRYLVSPLGIEIRRGIIWRQIINVPQTRVQHTDVAQGPLMRRYGIATLIIHTAGTENASVELSGVGYETALLIRDFLIRGGENDAV